MVTIPFDSLGYFEKLKDAGMPEGLAKVQAALVREQTEIQNVALQTAIKQYDDATRKEIATKGDIQDVRNVLKTDIQEVRSELKAEIQDVRNELKAEIQDVRNELASTKHEILKWVMGIALVQTAAIVAVIGVAIALVMR